MRALAALFGWAVHLRNRLYDRGFLRARRAPVPVVSAGALAAGGAGKTPLARLVAERLRERGLRVAILSHGYRGALRRRGGRVLPGGDAAHAGDEALMLARALEDVPVFAGRDRVRLAALAAAGGAKVLVLDDGFQHRRLWRDLDLLLVDGGSRLEDARLLPAGPLREPLGPALLRTHAVVVRGEGPPPPGYSGPWLRVVDEAAGLWRHPQGAALPLEELCGRPVALVAGIARPERFAAMARALGAEVIEERFFSDHHRFRPADLAGAPAEILTTAKDAVRLPWGVAALVLEHRLRVVEGSEVLDSLLERAVGGRR